MRAVVDLQWAAAIDQRPKCIPENRPRKGSKALGLRYERQVFKALPDGCRHGPWYVFRDANGQGYCQPDIIVPGKDLLAILEIKLTDIDGARAQLNRLYRPVVEFAHDLPTIGVIVARHLSNLPDDIQVFPSLFDALHGAKPNTTPVVHWLGHGTL